MIREVKSEASVCPYYCSCIQVWWTQTLCHVDSWYSVWGPDGSDTPVVMQLLVGAICMSSLTGNCSLMKHKFAEALLTLIHQFYCVPFIASLSTTAVAGWAVKCRVSMLCCVSCWGSLKTLQCVVPLHLLQLVKNAMHLNLLFTASVMLILCLQICCSSQ
jgi:hypothetical protein